MNFISHQFRKMKFPFTYLMFKKGNNKLKKWMKKNDKFQDPNYYPYNERWEYAIKKTEKLVNASGSEIKLIGEEYVPKSSCLITPNHVSNADILILAKIFGPERPVSGIFKEELLDDKKVNGYITALEGFGIDTKSARSALSAFELASKWSKENKRGMIIFPEGTRNNNEDQTLNEFKPGAFHMAKKFYLPIVPVTIIGAKQALKWTTNSTNQVIVIFHKPIKQKEIINLSTQKIAKKVSDIIQRDLDKYSEGKVT